MLSDKTKSRLFISIGECDVAARENKLPMRPVPIEGYRDLFAQLQQRTTRVPYTRARWHTLSDTLRTKRKKSLPWLVGGKVNGERRDANVTNRCLLTLDLERQWREVTDQAGTKVRQPNSEPMLDYRRFRKSVSAAAAEAGFGLIYYMSTGYTEDDPRYRIFVLLSEPIADKRQLKSLTIWAAQKLGLRKWLGPESYTYAQAMFLPVDFAPNDRPDIDDLLSLTPDNSGLRVVDGPPVDPSSALHEIGNEDESATVLYGDVGPEGKDPIPVALLAAGLNPRPHPLAGVDPEKKGWLLFDCPFGEQHGTHNDSQTCYMPPAGLRCLDTAPDEGEDAPHLTFRKLVDFLVEGGYLSSAPILVPPGIGQQPLGELLEQFFRGRMLFDVERDAWLEFDAGFGWTVCEAGEHRRRVVEQVIPWLANRAASLPADTPQYKKLQALLKLARTHGQLEGAFHFLKAERTIATKRRMFDTNPYALGLLNGWIDLSADDISLRPYGPGVLMSKRAGTSWEPAARCPIWMRFLRTVVPDDDLRAYLQRVAGYLLTGDVSLEKLFFLHGSGANGKSTFVETLQALLGEYAVGVRSGVVMRSAADRNAGSATPELIPLVGARMAIAHETEAGVRLSGKRVKELASTDAVTARQNYGHEFSFVPTAKILMVGNHKPIVTDTDDGLWRRLVLLPFTQTIPEHDRDPDFKRKLLDELPGILVWAVEGARHILSTGDQLTPPEIAKRATQSYRSDSDVLGEWLRERCELVAAAVAPEPLVYNDYRDWIEKNGLGKPWSKKQFTLALHESYGVQSGVRHRVGGVQAYHYRGIRLLSR